MSEQNPKGEYIPSLQLAIDYLLETYDFRKNMVTTSVELKSKNENNFDEVNENDILIELKIKQKIKIGMSDLCVFLGSSYIKPYDPLNEYFEKVSKIYSPEIHGDYIQKFSRYVKANNQERFDIQFKKWLVRTVACALKDDYFNKQAFMLVAEGQDIGKTSFTRFLIPRSLTRYCVENISTDKDSLIALSGNFIGILDELANHAKLEINTLKSSMSKLHVNVRHPYDKRPKLTPRRISFIGSTNETEFLTDYANVRWLCFQIDEINWAYRDEIDIDVVWSQAYYLMGSGFKYDMTRQEIEENEKNNENFKVTTLEFELLHKYFSPGSENDYDALMMASDMMHEIQLKTFPKLNQKEFGRALKRLGFISQQRRGYITNDGDRLSYPVNIYFVKHS